jgi:hypothetical protein
MNRAAFVLFVSLCCGAAACASSGGHPAARPAQVVLEDQLWRPIALADIRDPELRRAVNDLLMFVDMDVLWPGFRLAEDPAIVVDSRDPRYSSAYCVGHCVPLVAGAGGTSRVWRRNTPDVLAPNKASFTSLESWQLAGDGEIVAAGFSTREHTVTILLHEHFHLHYQTAYGQSFGDEIRGDGSLASHFARADLESSYSASQPTTTELRQECGALVDALRAGRGAPSAAVVALRRFSAVRDTRRSRPDSPAFEEDFWERQEGVPVNLERRVAKRLRFADPSVIETALMHDGCDAIPRVSYLLVLGGLQSAVLDELGDARAWPDRVYPRDGTSASSLYVLIRALLNQSEERQQP